MASTYEPIASQALGSNAASVDFTSISGSYTDLIVVAIGQSAGSGTGMDNLEIRVGNTSVDTGSNYSRIQMTGDGSYATSVRSSNQSTVRASSYFPRDSDPNINPGIAFAHIFSYANTSVFKTVLTSSAGEAYVDRRAHLWRSTSAINTIKVFCTSTNLKAGTVISLYGIKAA